MELVFNQWFGLHVREYFDNWDDKTMVDSSWLENLEFPYLNYLRKEWKRICPGYCKQLLIDNELKPDDVVEILCNYYYVHS